MAGRSGRLRRSGTAGLVGGRERVKRTGRQGTGWEDEHPQFGRVPEMERRSEREIRFPFSLTLPYIPIKQTTPSPVRHHPAFPRHMVLSYHPFLDGQAQCSSRTAASLSSLPSIPVPRTAPPHLLVTLAARHVRQIRIQHAHIWRTSIPS